MLNKSLLEPDGTPGFRRPLGQATLDRVLLVPLSNRRAYAAFGYQAGAEVGHRVLKLVP